MGLNLARGSDTDPDAGRSNGGEGAEGGTGDHGEDSESPWWCTGEDWLDENWMVGQTVEEVNELWETRRCAGWWREVAEGTGTGGGDEPPPLPLPPPPPTPPPPPLPSDGGGSGEGSADGGARRPVGGGGGSNGKRQRERAGGAAKEVASLIQCALGEVRVGKAMLKGQAVIRLAEVVAGRRRKQAKRTSEEQRVVTSVDGILVTTLGVVISDGKDSEDSSNTTRGTVDDEEGDMRRRGARECDEALMEATEARRGYARVAAWDEGNLIQAMARLKNPTIAWRYGDG